MIFLSKNQIKWHYHILSQNDQERILEDGPWSFDNHLLILGRVNARDIQNEILLFHIPLLVQVHDIPIGFMTQTNGKHLSNFISEFIKYDPKNNAEVGRTTCEFVSM